MALSRRRMTRTASTDAQIKSDLLGEEEPRKMESETDILGKIIEEVNSTETADRLSRLFAIASRPLVLLTNEQCADLAAIRKLSRLAYGTLAYSEFHSRVMRIFSPPVSTASLPVSSDGSGTSVLPPSYSPHTVGSFFVGCVTPNNLNTAVPGISQGCTLLCADSLPPPMTDPVQRAISGTSLQNATNPTWGFCSQNVIWCLLSSSTVAKNLRDASKSHQTDSLSKVVDIGAGPESFDFVYLTYLPSISKAILFVDYSSHDSFPGFTRHEKARLIHRMHINEVKLLSYSGDATNYTDLIGRTILVQNIKSRSDPRDSETSTQRANRRLKSSMDSADKNSVSMGILAAHNSDSAMTWQTGVILGFALVLLFAIVFLAVFAGIRIPSLFRRENASKPSRQ